ncbi:MAG: hypothetical protein ACXIUV_12285 [Alkalilacustris sp.]
MTKPALAALAALMVLAGCGGVRQSALNPFTWFQGGASEPSIVPEGGFRARTDGRPLVAQVTELAVEPAQGGAIVRAVGLPATQGWWDAELQPDGDLAPVDGELLLRFVVAPPRQPTPAGPPRSRELSAGVFVPTRTLAATRRITVVAEEGARSISR